MQADHRIDAVTVNLNPAIDQTLQIRGFAPDKVNRVEEASSCPGGKGVNVAVALADFGVPVAVTGFLGRDNAEGFEAMFARKRICDRFIRIPGQTRTGIKICDPERRQTTDINFPGLAPRRSDLATLRQTLKQVAAPGRWFVLSGSLPPALDSDTYAALVALLKRNGARIILDTSGEPLRRAVQAHPHIIKPNIHELESLIGERPADVGDIVEAARRLLSAGMERGVVSMGKEGACFVTQDECIVAVPPQVHVKSTVGAGDAMVAGVLAAQIAGLSLEDTARVATAFSIEVVTRGQSGLRSRASVRRWASSVVSSSVLTR